MIDNDIEVEESSEPLINLDVHDSATVDTEVWPEQEHAIVVTNVQTQDMPEAMAKTLGLTS